MRKIFSSQFGSLKEELVERYLLVLIQTQIEFVDVDVEN